MKRSIRVYGCVKCQRSHNEYEPVFQEHILFQSKHGWHNEVEELNQDQVATINKYRESARYEPLLSI